MKSFINIDMVFMFRFLMIQHGGPRSEDSIATAMLVYNENFFTRTAFSTSNRNSMSL